MKRFLAVVLLLLALIAAFLAHAVWADRPVLRDVVYLPGIGTAGRLDLHLQPGSRARPTLVYFHGGGWGPGTRKEDVGVRRLPFLYLGWNVVTVEYRRSDTAPAPAAVEDCLCAVRWVAANAERYHIDRTRLVLMGDSAGGHLALISAMIPDSAGLDRQCPGEQAPKIAAIVDWSGVTDVAALLDGPDARTFAKAWIGDGPESGDLARLLSPIRYVRAGLPPIFITHADRDPVAPYFQSVRLYEALKRAGVPTALVTVHDDRHMKVSRPMTAYIYLRMLLFFTLNSVFPIG